MIKTLRITSIIAVILAGIVFVLPVVFGARSNPTEAKLEQLLNSPGAIEKFNQAQADKATKDQGQSSPLVKQAQALALYLNPSQPKNGPAVQRMDTPSPRGPVTAKFTLIGTSFYETRPELSLAFIDEPGKGWRWVRPFSQIGHLTIEQIKDGLIVVRDGQNTYELKAEERPLQSALLEGSSSEIAVPISTSTMKTGVDATSSGPATSPLPDKQHAALEELVEKLRNLQKDIKSRNDNSQADAEVKAELMEKFITDFKETRVSNEEAEKLGDLGKELKDVQSASDRIEDEGKKAIKPIKPASSNLPIKK
jgi:hypothetical protein